jgi:copper chaperone CopZ
MATVKFAVPNISCGHCVKTIQTEVAELAGVQTVSADAATKVVEITFELPADEERLRTFLAEINYPVAGFAL